MLEFDKVSKFFDKEISSIKKETSFSNEVYSFDCENQSYIYKNLKNHSRSRFESDITGFLYSQGLCPEPVEFFENEYLILKKVDGSELTVSEFESWSWIDSLRVLHTKHFEAGIFKIENEIYELYRKNSSPSLYKDAIADLGTKTSFFAELYSHLTLCHLDLNPKNILRKDGTYLFIDFELTMMSSPLIDLSHMLAHRELGSQQKQMLFDAYGLAPREAFVVLKLEKYSCLYWALWCRTSSKSQEWESFYFERYRNLFHRVRSEPN